jgi:hypothetical protein
MEPNFVIVKGPDPLNILVEAFPEIKHLLEDADFSSYYVYARFSEFLASRADDEYLWSRAYSFFETLANESSALKDLLVNILETLCADIAIANKIKANAGPATLILLEKMEA